jgi:DNA polymerase-3 subunit epsilon
VELTGGRQRGFALAAETAAAEIVVYTHESERTPRPIVPSADELTAHAAFIARLKDPLWLAP